jgi:hypothetical protein
VTTNKGTEDGSPNASTRHNSKPKSWVRRHKPMLLVEICTGLRLLADEYCFVLEDMTSRRKARLTYHANLGQVRVALQERLLKGQLRENAAGDTAAFVDAWTLAAEKVAPLLDPLCRCLSPRRKTRPPSTNQEQREVPK